MKQEDCTYLPRLQYSSSCPPPAIAHVQGGGGRKWRQQPAPRRMRRSPWIKRDSDSCGGLQFQSRDFDDEKLRKSAKHLQLESVGQKVAAAAAEEEEEEEGAHAHGGDS